MVLDLPRVVVTKAISELELFQSIVVEPVFVVLLPWPRKLHLIENAELHGAPPELAGSKSQGGKVANCGLQQYVVNGAKGALYGRIIGCCHAGSNEGVSMNFEESARSAVHTAARSAALTAERIYSQLEYRADAVVHGLGILFAINATAWLLWNVTGLSVAVSVTIYCVGLLAMIGLSAAYNLAPDHLPSKSVLRKLDHCAIFIMIAGTYTPFAAGRLGDYGPWILVANWSAATLGIVMKLAFPRRFELLSIGLYIAMGWLIVIALKPLIANVASIDLWLLLGGGLVYSAGIAFYLIEKIPYHKAIWHAFVLIAAVLQFLSIAFEFG
jgi:hemolysin III